MEHTAEISEHITLKGEPACTKHVSAKLVEAAGHRDRPRDLGAEAIERLLGVISSESAGAGKYVQGLSQNWAKDSELRLRLIALRNHLLKAGEISGEIRELIKARTAQEKKQ